MAKYEILDKLNDIFKESNFSDCHVVYILSRIRILIEFDNRKDDFKFLMIYCHWVLHSQIDRTKQIEIELIEFINGSDKGFLNFDFFKNDFLRFIKEYGLNLDIIQESNKYYSLVNQLLSVISDMPLNLKVLEGNYQIILYKPLTPIENFHFTVGFKVVKLF